MDWKTEQWLHKEPYNLLWFLEKICKFSNELIMELVAKECIAIDGYAITQRQLFLEPKSIDNPDDIEVKIIVEYPEDAVATHVYDKEVLIASQRRKEDEEEGE